MAVVQQPFGSIQASGSIAGMTSSVSRAGQILRQRRRPRQPRSQAVQTIRYNFASLNRSFQNLTKAQIESWQDFADTWSVPGKLGSTIYLNALNWFAALNSPLLRLGVSLQTAPPLNPNPEYFPAISIELGSSPADIQITFDTAPSNNEAIWVYWTNPLPITSRFQKKSIRLQASLDSTATSPVQLIEAADVTADTAVYQFAVICTDDNGRATPRQNFELYVNT